MSIADYVGGLAEFLSADADVAALTPSVVAPEIRNTDVPSMPKKIVVLRPSGGIHVIGRGYVGVKDHRVDVFCYGETPYEADRLHRAVYGALINLRRNVKNGTLLYWAQPESVGWSLRDPDTEWPFVQSTWQVLAGEEAVT